MDNTDGVGQCLAELSEASGTAFLVEEDSFELPSIVKVIAEFTGQDPISFALGAGADFDLVGTLTGDWSQEAMGTLDPCLMRVGRVEAGTGLFRTSGSGERLNLDFSGWNYFAPPPEERTSEMARRTVAIIRGAPVLQS